MFCDPVGIRTQDPQLRRLLLYPAELPDHRFCVCKDINFIDTCVKICIFFIKNLTRYKSIKNVYYEYHLTISSIMSIISVLSIIPEKFSAPRPYAKTGTIRGE